MAKPYSGNLHARISPDLHARVAREAFESGASISDLVSQALEVRALLSDIDPWKTFRANWKKNASVTESEIEQDALEAVRAVRSHRSGHVK